MAANPSDHRHLSRDGKRDVKFLNTRSRIYDVGVLPPLIVLSPGVPGRFGTGTLFTAVSSLT